MSLFFSSTKSASKGAADDDLSKIPASFWLPAGSASKAAETARLFHLEINAAHASGWKTSWVEAVSRSIVATNAACALINSFAPAVTAVVAEGAETTSPARPVYMPAPGSHDFPSAILGSAFRPEIAKATSQSLRQLSARSGYSAYTCHMMHVIGCTIFHASTRHLFSAAEHDVARRIVSLSPRAAGMLSRCFGRKGPWFRVSTFSRYSEVFAEEAIGSGTVEEDVCVALIPPLPPSSTDGDGRVDQGDVKPVQVPRRWSRMKKDIPSHTIQSVVSDLLNAAIFSELPGAYDSSASRGSSGGRDADSEGRSVLVLEAISCLFSVGEIKATLRSLGVRIPSASAQQATTERKRSASGMSPAPGASSTSKTIQKPARSITTSSSTFSSSSSAAAAAAPPPLLPSGGARYAAGQQQALGRDGLYALLVDSFGRQRTVFGGRLPLAKAAAAALAESLPPAASSDDEDDMRQKPAGGAASRGAVSAGIAPPTLHHVVRMKTFVSELLRRCHGLFYLCTATAHLSSGMGTGSWPLFTGSCPLIGPISPPPVKGAAAAPLSSGMGPSSPPPSTAAGATAHSAGAGSAVSSTAAAKALDVIEISDDDEGMLDDYEAAPEFERCPLSLLSRVLLPTIGSIPVASLRTSIHDTLPQCVPRIESSVSIRCDDGGSKEIASPPHSLVCALLPSSASQPIPQRNRWSTGSGSKYADTAAGSDSFIPAGAGAGSGVAAVARRGVITVSSSAALAQSSAAALLSRGGGIGTSGTGKLYSPALLQLMKQLDFADIDCSAPTQAAGCVVKPGSHAVDGGVIDQCLDRGIFASRSELSLFEIAHLFRSQVDHTSALAIPAEFQCVSAALRGRLETASVSDACNTITAGSGETVSRGKCVGEVRGSSAVTCKPSSKKPPRGDDSDGIVIIGSQESVTAVEVVMDSRLAKATPAPAETQIGEAWLPRNTSSLHVFGIDYTVSDPAIGVQFSPLLPPVLAGLQLLLFAPLLLEAVSLDTWLSTVLDPCIAAFDAGSILSLPVHATLAGVLCLSRAVVDSGPFFCSVCGEPASCSCAMLRSGASKSRVTVDASTCVASFSLQCVPSAVGSCSLAATLCVVLPVLIAVVDGRCAGEGAAFLAKAMGLPASQRSLSPADRRCIRASMLHIGLCIAAATPISLLVAFRASLCMDLCRIGEHLSAEAADCPGTSAAEAASSALEPNAAVSPLSRHPWLHQLSAGSIYASALWEAVDPLERGRLYPHTLPLLYQLVCCPFTPHRSGRWWARLCLNLSHCGLHADAALASEAGLRPQTAHVRAGDRLQLALRHVRLVRKLVRIISSSAPGSTTVTVQQVASEANALANRVCINNHLSDRVHFGADPAAAGADPDMPLFREICDVTRDAAAREVPTDSNHTLSSQQRWVQTVACPHANNHNCHGSMDSVNSSSAAAVPLAVSSSSVPARHSRPLLLRVDAFVRRPLNKSASEHSRFVADIDTINDRDSDSESLNGNGGRAQSAGVSAAAATLSAVDLKERVKKGHVVALEEDGGLLGTPRQIPSTDAAAAGGGDAAMDCLVLAGAGSGSGSSDDDDGLLDADRSVGLVPLKTLAATMGAIDLAMGRAVPARHAHGKAARPSAALLPRLAPALYRNITDEVCAGFGWTYPHAAAPGRHVLVSLPKPAPPPSEMAVTAAAADDVAALETVGGVGIISEATDAEQVDAAGESKAEIEGADDDAAAAESDGSDTAVQLKATATEVPKQSTGNRGGRFAWRFRPKPSADVSGSDLRLTVEQLALSWYYFHERTASARAREEDADAPAAVAAVAAARTVPGDSSIGWRGTHAEGGPLYTLVALCSWDLRFAPGLPGAFLTPYQDAPLDLDSPGIFHARRRARIRDRVAFLCAADSGALVRFVGGVWRAQFGRACRGVQWTTPLPLLQLLAAGLGGPALACVVDALAQDHKHLSGGFPDLLLWRVLLPLAEEPSPPLPGENCAGNDLFAGEPSQAQGWVEASPPAAAAASPASSPCVAPSLGAAAVTGVPDLRLPRGAIVQVRVVEVKGPRDTLSEKQHHWLRILLTAGVETSVCKIVETAKPASGRRGGARATAAKGRGKQASRKSLKAPPLPASTIKGTAAAVSVDKVDMGALGRKGTRARPAEAAGCHISSSGNDKRSRLAASVRTPKRACRERAAAAPHDVENDDDDSGDEFDGDD